MSEAQEGQNSFHNKLTEQLIGVFDGAAEARRSYYEANPDKRPSPGDIDSIITKYSYMNAAIVGALTLIPGPWGLFAVVPEIVLVIRNQVKMVYDIGVAHGKDEVMTRELLLGISMSATGTGTIGFLTMHGGKVLVRRPALRVFQKLIAVFAGRITQRLIKSAIAKWVPVVGAIAMAVWTKTSTARVGRTANEILAKPIEISEGDPSGVLEDNAVVPKGSTADALEQKLHALANLMKADGDIGDTELEYIETILENGDLDIDTVEEIRASLTEPNQQAVDFTPFEDEDEALGLIMDMVALANRDGVFHSAERLYIRQVAKRINFPAEDVEALTAT
ncbi:MAG: TerB family tellurite resistance protein [Proteobacteria bacterium]|jgi:uncharacterized protein (DUF697 family)/uncharacterized tellurite resistance protein B-like protein|nr:TerB family tellurite resistance protein [Pseudomonadota bacterium]